jgi:hypothetical protein
MIYKPLFVLRQNLLLLVALQPLPDGVNDSASVKLGLRLGQATVISVGVTQVIFENQLDVLVPLDDCRAKILVALHSKRDARQKGHNARHNPIFCLSFIGDIPNGCNV